jgi:hypothetical protein
MKLIELYEDERMERAASRGFTLRLYHKTSSPEFDKFAPFSHFGTAEQASMRGAVTGSRILPVLVRLGKVKRMKDSGKWNIAQLRSLERQGYNGVVYLNRFEGIPIEEYDKFGERSNLATYLERLPDSKFHQLLPSAADSYIVFDPTNIRSAHAKFGSLGSNLTD